MFSTMGSGTQKGDGLHWRSRYGNLISGYSGSLTVSPETGDIVVILASNSRLPAWEFVHQTVSDWAPEAG